MWNKSILVPLVTAASRKKHGPQYRRGILTHRASGPPKRGGILIPDAGGRVHRATALSELDPVGER